MHDEQPAAARGSQQLADRLDGRAQQLDIQSGLLGVAAWRAEVALHIDHQQRGVLSSARGSTAAKGERMAGDIVGGIAAAVCHEFGLENLR